MASGEGTDTGGSYTIGDLSKLYGVSLRALRFYEERELLRPQRDGHHRIYSDDDRLRLEAILKAKRLGFSLAEIWDLLEGRAKANDGSSPAPAFLGLSSDEISAQIERLQHESERVGMIIEELRHVAARFETPEEPRSAAEPQLIVRG